MGKKYKMGKMSRNCTGKKLSAYEATNQYVHQLKELHGDARETMDDEVVYQPAYVVWV